MPRPRKPPRLVLRRDRDGKRRYVIRDCTTYLRTGCAADQTGDAEQSFREYLAHKAARPDTSIRHASKAGLANIMSVYLEAKEGSVARPAELRARIARLVRFWGAMTADQIRGESCRRYVKERGAVIAARRELETLRAAVRHYTREYGLDVTPLFTLPENSKSRERWLTRSEAARLLWAAYRSPHHKHLVRFILIGLYTGTRHSAILGLQWMPNTTGGWIDLERGVLFRRGVDQRETKKRRPPSRLPSRLLAHLARWKVMDGGRNIHVVRYAGEHLRRLEKSFRGAREKAKLSADVTPHVLRHTRATWLMQAGVDMWEAAGSLGMTVETLQNTYGHHHADFQKNAAEAY